MNDPYTAARVLRECANIEVASLSKPYTLDTHWQLDMANGALFGVPIPEEYEAVGAELQASVEQAVRESEENGVSRRGKEATPWLLQRVGELTAGKSLQSSAYMRITCA